MKLRRVAEGFGGHVARMARLERKTPTKQTNKNSCSEIFASFAYLVGKHVSAPNIRFVRVIRGSPKSQRLVPCGPCENVANGTLALLLGRFARATRPSPFRQWIRW